MFGVLCHHEKEMMNMNKTCTSYAKGQLLFHEGSKPVGVYCINQGKVKVSKLGDEGRDQIIRIATPGGLLGYKALLSEEIYNVSAEAIEDTNVCFIPKEDFLLLVRENIPLQSKLLKAACRELGAMPGQITDMAQKPVRERVASTLLMLKDTYGIEGHDDGAVEINLTREDLAGIVGTATETLIRALSDFKEEGLIESAGRKIRVINAKGLYTVANLG